MGVSRPRWCLQLHIAIMIMQKVNKEGIKMKLMTETEYALYKGDKFIDLGTIDYLAKKYHKKKETLKYLTYPSTHKRGRKTLLYKIKGD